MSSGSFAGAHQEAGAPSSGRFRPYDYGGPMSGLPASARFPDRWGQVGRVRGTAVAVLLFAVTLGVYGLFYTYFTHHELRRHSGDGIGGGLAVVISLLAGIASPFLLSGEVGTLYERAARPRPVSAGTGAWAMSVYLVIFLPALWWYAGIPGWVLIPVALLLLAGPVVWFVKTNRALNAYWRTFAAR